ncbi:MAG: hypothetical protein R2851_04615 [Caldilineaceae bacterium]
MISEDLEETARSWVDDNDAVLAIEAEAEHEQAAIAALDRHRPSPNHAASGGGLQVELRERWKIVKGFGQIKLIEIAVTAAGNQDV